MNGLLDPERDPDDVYGYPVNANLLAQAAQLLAERWAMPGAGMPVAVALPPSDGAAAAGGAYIPNPNLVAQGAQIRANAQARRAGISATETGPDPDIAADPGGTYYPNPNLVAQGAGIRANAQARSAGATAPAAPPEPGVEGDPNEFYDPVNPNLEAQGRRMRRNPRRQVPLYPGDIDPDGRASMAARAAIAHARTAEDRLATAGNNGLPLEPDGSGNSMVVEGGTGVRYRLDPRGFDRGDVAAAAPAAVRAGAGLLGATIGSRAGQVGAGVGYAVGDELADRVVRHYLGTVDSRTADQRMSDLFRAAGMGLLDPLRERALRRAGEALRDWRKPGP